MGATPPTEYPTNGVASRLAFKPTARDRRMRLTPWPLRLALVIDAALGLLLLLIMVAVRQGATTAWDRTTLVRFRDSADLSRGIGPVWLPETVRDLTGLGSTSVLATVIVIAAGFLVSARLWRSAVTLFGAVASAELICLLLKLAVDRPRPDLIPGAPRVFTESFPSSHAMISVLTYMLLAALVSQQVGRRGVRIYAFCTATCLTAAVGLTRIYLGVHWPSDVFAGWTAGLAWVLLCWIVAGRWCGRDRPGGDREAV